MKKLYLVAFCLFFSTVASAQDVEIPLFDDSKPNLGRTATPLDSIVLTPSPLPAIRIPLDDTKEPRPQQSVSQSQPLPEEKADLKTPRRHMPITVDQPKINQDKNEELARELQNQINRTQAASLKKKQPAVKSQPASTKETTMTPKSLENLFGKTHDVRTFDIGGFALGMTPDEVIETARDMGYRVTKIERGIPLFRTSFYEQNCRDAKIHIPGEIKTCIINQALADEVYYISSITMQKKATREYIQILFSSNATDNVAYKIFYENKGDSSLNFTRKNLAKKLRRKEAFWNLMFETYGLPDDSEKLIWGEPQKAYMQATMQGANYNAYIVMEDKEIPDKDYFDAEDQAKDLVYKTPFTFAGDAGED